MFIHAPTLSPIENTALNLIAEGFSAFDVAEKLALSRAETRSLERDILAKLDARSLAHAIMQCAKRGFINGLLILVCVINAFDASPTMRVRNSSRTPQSSVRIVRPQC